MGSEKGSDELNSSRTEFGLVLAAEGSSVSSENDDFLGELRSLDERTERELDLVVKMPGDDRHFRGEFSDIGEYLEEVEERVPHGEDGGYWENPAELSVDEIQGGYEVKLTRTYEIMPYDDGVEIKVFQISVFLEPGEFEVAKAYETTS